MTKTKSTKRALLMSALSLIICVSMLIGSTYAWFTDSVTSSGNKIVAGTLDIQLLMDGDVNGTYDDISNSTSPIFGEGSIAQDNNAQTLWEPGKTQVAYLAIKNNGNLDLKYTVGLNVQNVSKDLYKVMEYAIVPDADANNKVTAWNGGNSVVVGTQSVSDSVSLAVGATHYFALAIHMDEEAGNEYQGGEVNFDLTILATQLTSEFDSFDNQYDYAAGTEFVGGKGTAEAPYVINDAAGLLAISSLSEEYTYFELDESIDEIDMQGAPLDLVLCGSFNGNGVTIKNIAQDSHAFHTVYGKEGKVKAEGEAVIENVNIEYNNAPGGVVYWNTAKDFTLKNVNVTGTIEGQFNIGSFVDYCGSQNEANHNINIINCHSDATLITTGGTAAGFFGHPYSDSNSVFTIENSSFTGELYAPSGSNCVLYTACWFNGTATVDGVTTNLNGVSYDASKSHVITTITGTMPAKYGVFTATKEAGCATAVAHLIIGPNGNGTTFTGGYYARDYITEELDTTGTTLTTSQIKNYDLYCNAGTQTSTGIYGNEFHIVNSSYNDEIGGASVRLVQYDANGVILSITTWKLI